MSAAQVITRPNMLTWVGSGVFLAFVSFDSIFTLQDRGWLNPEAFFSETARFGRTNPIQTIPWVGHVTSLLVFGLLILQIIEAVMLARRGFNAIIFDGETFSEPGLLRIRTIDRDKITSVRRVSAFGKGLDMVEIRYRARCGAKDVEKRFAIMPWFYRESIDAIIANLAACGVRVSDSGAKEDAPAAAPPD